MKVIGFPEYSRRRFILLAILFTALMLVVSGCTKAKPRTINDSALAYMEQKYGEKFEYVKSWGSSYTTPGKRQILVSCGSLPDREILVIIKGKRSEETYSDNYMDFYYESQTVEYISQIANKYFSDFTFDINIVCAPSGKGILSDTGFDDYIRNENSFVSANMDINDSNKETVLKFLNELKELKVFFSFGIDILSVNEGYTAQYFSGDDDIYFVKRALP